MVQFRDERTPGSAHTASRDRTLPLPQRFQRMISFVPTLDRHEIRRRLESLFVNGTLDDPQLRRRVERLSPLFRGYAASVVNPWCPRGIVTPEDARHAEIHLPLDEINPVMRLLLQRSVRFDSPRICAAASSFRSWPDFLASLRLPDICCDPSRLLARLMDDPSCRLQFLFAFFIPARHGESFERYPEQLRFLLRHTGGYSSLRVLDAACGTGETTWRVAETLALQQKGRAVTVHGTSLEPAEVFAAAHGFFPHDRERMRHFRAGMAAALGAENVELQFSVEDVEDSREGEYDVILCNGLLGGPFFHDPARLQQVFLNLAARLAPGGMLLAADRFHEGWKRKVPQYLLEELARQAGLTVMTVPEGIGAARTGS